jgi:hypothetical protein
MNALSVVLFFDGSYHLLGWGQANFVSCGSDFRAIKKTIEITSEKLRSFRALLNRFFNTRPSTTAKADAELVGKKQLQLGTIHFYFQFFGGVGGDSGQSCAKSQSDRKG